MLLIKRVSDGEFKETLNSKISVSLSNNNNHINSSRAEEKAKKVKAT